MTTDNVFSTYDLMSNLAANRPATPTVANGRLVVFQATDTGDVFIWNSSTSVWVMLTPQNRFSTMAQLGGVGTASAILVANGFGSTLKLTPKTTGRVRFRATLLIKNSTAGDGVLAQACYGTGTAPVNGGSLAGATFPNAQSMQYTATTANALAPCTLEFEASGLTINTPYWFDVGFATITGGNAFVYTMSVIVEEF